MANCCLEETYLAKGMYEADLVRSHGVTDLECSYKILGLWNEILDNNY